MMLGYLDSQTSLPTKLVEAWNSLSLVSTVVVDRLRSKGFSVDTLPFPTTRLKMLAALQETESVIICPIRGDIIEQFVAVIQGLVYYVLLL